jgi:hypothetical protein
MLLLKQKPFYTLDNYLDIEHFLSLKDEFYFLFAKNKDRAVSSWNAGSIPIDCQWRYIIENPFLYYTLHKNQDSKFTEFDNKEQLAVYLQLKYGSFNPYKILHLIDYTSQKNIEPWVTPAIHNWIHTLPFEKIDSVSFFYNDHYCPLKFHRDFNFLPYEKGEQCQPDKLQDLIWFRFDTDREFFLYDINESGNITHKVPVEGHTATFNHYNWHGNIDAYNKSSLTIKVEGKFSEDFNYD